ncbi:uncharacterized protein BCR38DRAFT_411565 [Pseudomassariella vexata]|uniref:Uncharacterized protein n=1 Tax=Pseudomassariella vexata TaxID=1141098 RepID=A0A1Y2DRA2_9PEZI|nr:uncharacterized protein BCR38DRAFT_411565 [Pseudomassariella vexata]ORY61719.1 hypothetical protein BCR38DRAFT_411565 [Pseudomassariella vexata]
MSKENSSSLLYNKGKANFQYCAVLPETSAEQIPPVSDTLEKPKVALRRHFNPLKHLIHLVALGATAGVLQLIFRSVYWSDENTWTTERKWLFLGLGQTDAMNSLQFVSKIHEILIVASLSSVVIHVARRKLVGKDGILFGLLMGAYQVGSVEYLFSGKFGHPFLHSLRLFDRRAFLFTLGLGFSIVYANMVGPASAIALVPSLDWWPLKDPFSSRPLTSYIWVTPNELYPRALTSDMAKEVSSSCSTTIFPFATCPGGGVDNLLDWVYAWSNEGITYDLPMESFLGRTLRKLSFARTLSASGTGVAVATTLHSSVVMLTDLFWEYISQNDVGEVYNVKRPKLLNSDSSSIYNPIVQVQCTTYDAWDLQNKSQSLKFQTNLLHNATGSLRNPYGEDNGWKVDDALWNFQYKVNTMDFQWIDVSNLPTRSGGPVHSTIGALATLPIVRPIGKSDAEGTPLYESRIALVPCMIDARWAATQLSYDPKNGMVVEHNLTTIASFLDADPYTPEHRVQYGLSDTLAMDPEWAALLNGWGYANWTLNSLPYSNFSAVANLLVQFISDSDRNPLEMSTSYSFTPRLDYTEMEYYANISSTVAGVVSMVVADGLAREQAPGTITALKPQHEDENGVEMFEAINLQYQAGGEKMPVYNQTASDASTMVSINYDVQRWGYGYGLRSQTMLFAVVVLLLHVGLCVGYSLQAFFFWVTSTGFTSHSWKDIGDIVALALVSREPIEFRNAAAGIKNNKIWLTKMNVRERDSCEIELVVNRRAGTLGLTEGLLAVDKKYGL